jgi:hypothetical protein
MTSSVPEELSEAVVGLLLLKVFKATQDGDVELPMPTVGTVRFRSSGAHSWKISASLKKRWQQCRAEDNT